MDRRRRAIVYFARETTGIIQRYKKDSGVSVTMSQNPAERADFIKYPCALMIRPKSQDSN